MIRTLIDALASACGPRPTTLRDRCADARARAADPAVADDARALLAAQRELARVYGKLDQAARIADQDARDTLELWRHVRDLRAAIARHKAARKRAGRYVRDLLRELVEARAERDAARAARGTAEARQEKTARLLREAMAREEGEAKRAADALSAEYTVRHELDAEMRARAVESGMLRHDLAAMIAKRDAALAGRDAMKRDWSNALALLDERAGVADERDAAVASLASTRSALAELPVHMRVAVALRLAGWEVPYCGPCTRGDQAVGIWDGIFRLYDADLGTYTQHPWADLPAPAEGEHPALAIIRRAVAGEALP